jgi:hypothetical protein
MDVKLQRERSRRRRTPKWPWVVGALVVFVAGATIGWVLFLRDGGALTSVGGGDDPSSLEESAGPVIEGSTEATGAAVSKRQPTQVAANAQEVMADLVVLNESPTEGSTGGEPSASPMAPLPDPLDASVAPSTAAGMRRIGTPAVTGTSVVADYRGPDGGAIDVLRLSIVRYATSAEADTAVAAGFEEYPTARITFDAVGRSIEQGATQEDSPEQFPPALMLVWRQGSDVMTVLVAPAAPASASAARTLALEFVGALPY